MGRTDVDVLFENHHHTLFVGLCGVQDAGGQNTTKKSQSYSWPNAVQSSQTFRLLQLAEHCPPRFSCL